MRNRFSKKAFTLVELLIVVVIIGILATAIIPRFGSARAAARNGVRQNDLSALASAIDLYYSVKNILPPAGLNNCVANMTTTLTNEYISTLPSDPGSQTANGTCAYYYEIFDSSAGQYMLLADAEGEADAVNDNKGCTTTLITTDATTDSSTDILDLLELANACVSPGNVVYGVVR